MLLFSSVISDGQISVFKKKIKNPSGSTSRTIEFIMINGNKQLKSSSTAGTYQLSTNLKLPGFVQDDKTIRKVIYKNKAPVYIEKETSGLKSTEGINAEDKLHLFLETAGLITKIADSDIFFKIEGIQTDRLGITHIRTTQQYKGIEIYGSQSVFHFDDAKERFTGRLHHIKKDVDIHPKLSEEEIIQKAIADLKNITIYRELTNKEKEFLKYFKPVCKKIIYKQDDSCYIIACEIDIRPNFVEEWKYFVDAVNGRIIRKFNNTKSDGPTAASGYDLNNQLRTFNVYLEQGIYYLYNSSEDIYNATTEEGIIVTLDANNTSTSNLDYSYVTSTDNSWLHKAGRNVNKQSQSCKATSSF